MPFDLAAARQAGKTDDQIASYLGQTLGFDVDAAVKSGKTPSDIAEYLSTHERPKVEEPKGFASSVGSDIGKRSGNVADIFTKNVPADESVMGSVNKLPSRALQVIGQGSGLVNDVTAEGLKSAYRMFVPKSAQEYLSEKASAISESPTVQSTLKSLTGAYEGAKERFPEGMRNVEAVANITGALPILKGASLVGKGSLSAGKEGVNIAKDVAKIAGGSAEESFTRKLDNVVRYGVEKALRPSVAGKGTAPQMKSYYDRATSAVKDIISNKENLVLTDAEGNAIKGALPSSLKQFSEAVDQTKKNIFRQYDDMAKQAGENGAIVKLDPAVNELEKVGKSVVLQDNAPEVASYAQTRAVAFKNRGSYTTEEAQDAIAIYNKSLEAYYRNPSYENASKAGIDALIANNLRKSLDKSIETLAGPGYQDLKNSYGALKEIEEDVTHRAIVDARKNIKGLVDFTDIYTSGELVAGLATQNPGMILKGGVWKGVQQYIKIMNNPNRVVKSMFGNAESLINNQTAGFKSKTFNALTREALPPQEVARNMEILKSKLSEVNPEQALRSKLNNSPETTPKAVGGIKKLDVVNDVSLDNFIDHIEKEKTGDTIGLRGIYKHELGKKDLKPSNDMREFEDGTYANRKLSGTSAIEFVGNWDNLSRDSLIASLGKALKDVAPYGDANEVAIVSGNLSKNEIFNDIGEIVLNDAKVIGYIGDVDLAALSQIKKPKQLYTLSGTGDFVKATTQVKNERGGYTGYWKQFKKDTNPSIIEEWAKGIQKEKILPNPSRPPEGIKTKPKGK